MHNSATIDQIQYLFTFPFKDKNWKNKFLIGFLLYLGGFILPLIPWIFVAGYIYKIIQMGIEAEDYHLPEWEDWGDLFSRGLQFTGVGLIASLPFIVLLGCGYLAVMSPAMLSEMGSHSYGREAESAFILISMFGSFGGMCLMGLGTLSSLFVGVLIPPALSHMVARDQFSAAFRVREWWPIFKANLGGYLISYILLLGTTFLLTFAFQMLYMTLILCCTIPLVMSLVSFYIGIFMGAIFGQAYRVGVENQGLDLLPQEVDPAGS